MRTTLALLTLLTSGCLVIADEDPTTRRDDPITDDTSCDADQDGVWGTDCGGPDCDDLDPSIRPGADEIFGDDVDQDCDGDLDAHLDRVDAPARTTPLDAAWQRDLRGLGGVVVSPTGRLLAQQIELDDRFRGGATGKWRTDYGPAPDGVRAVRLEDDTGLLDVVATDTTLALYRPGPSVAAPEATLPWGPGRVDAHLGADTTWAVRCDGTTVEILGLDANRLVETARHTLAHPATTCALLGGATRPAVLLAGGGGDLERWNLEPTVGLTDRLRLAPDFEPERVRVDATPDDGVLAALVEGTLYVFDRSGRGLLAGDGRATDAFDVAIDEDGTLAVAWVDVDGTLHALLDEVDATPLVATLTTGLDAEDVRVGLTPEELAVAVQAGPDLRLARALR